MNRAKEMKKVCLLVLLLMLLAGCAVKEATAAQEENTPEPAKTRYEILVLVESRELFLFCDEELFRVYPVAIGKTSTPTPKGDFTVVNKIECPYRKAYGTRWIGLSAPGIGIHGTNDPSSIGTHASNGCIRMLNEDIEELFKFVEIGTRVFIL
ncbi:MAG: L,D-transpeptidase [Burkholderiales bacterium]